MSYASDTKNELARIEPEKKCCMLSEIAAYIKTAGSVELEYSGRLRISLDTDQAAIARHYKKLIGDYFGAETELEVYEGGGVGRNRKEKRNTYYINISAENKAEEILRECGILKIREGKNYLADGIS